MESFPELTVISRDSKTKSGVSAVSKIKMNGKAYNKKTLKLSKATTKLAQVSFSCHVFHQTLIQYRIVPRLLGYMGIWNFMLNVILRGGFKQLAKWLFIFFYIYPEKHNKELYSKLVIMFWVGNRKCLLSGKLTSLK